MFGKHKPHIWAEGLAVGNAERIGKRRKKQGRHNVLISNSPHLVNLSTRESFQKDDSYQFSELHARLRVNRFSNHVFLLE